MSDSHLIRGVSYWVAGTAPVDRVTVVRNNEN
jgi:hypothetical protein